MRPPSDALNTSSEPETVTVTQEIGRTLTLITTVTQDYGPVAVCRVLLNNPGIILADEPTGDLDGDSASAALTALRRSAADGRVVVIAAFVVEHADVVLTL